MQKLEVVSQHIATFSKEKGGLFDSLELSQTAHVQEYSWGLVVTASESSPIDTFLFFVHSGVSLPESAAEYMTDDQEIVTAETIVANVDLGGGLVATEVAQLLSEYPNAAIIWYDYTRLVGDANRVYVEEQVPYTPYRGSVLWNVQEDSIKFDQLREEITTQTTVPFFADVSRLVAKYQPKSCLYFHSYDPKSAGGTITKTVSDSYGPEALRPAGMVFYENPQVAERPFMSAEHRDDVVALLGQLFLAIPYVTTTERTDITVDEPYKAAESLLTYVDALIPDAEQLFFEVRKDLFTEAPDDTTQAVVTFMIQAMQLLSK